MAIVPHLHTGRQDTLIIFMYMVPASNRLDKICGFMTPPLLMSNKIKYDDYEQNPMFAPMQTYVMQFTFLNLPV